MEKRPMRGARVADSKLALWYQNGGPLVKLEGNGAKCTLVIDDTGEECGAEIETCSKKYSTSNLRKHLARHESDSKRSYLEWKQKEAEITKRLQGSGNNGDITQFATPKVKSAPPYKKSDQTRVKEIDDCVTAFVGTNIHVGYRQLEDYFFVRMVNVLDNRYQLPCRRVAAERAQEMSAKVEDGIRLCLDANDKINVGIDIWSDRKGESYMGFHAQFFDESVGEIKTFVIGLEPFPHPHDGASIMKLFHWFWTQKMNQKLEKLHRVLADNASNLLAGFKHHLADIAAKAHCESKKPDETPRQTEAVTDLEDIIDVTDSNGDYALNSNLPDHDHAYSIPAKDIDHCDHEEAEIKRELNKFCKHRHLPCFVHTIQLTIISGKKTEGMKGLLAKCAAIVAAVRVSSKQAQLLREKTGITLKSYVPTRWTSELTMVESLLQVESELPNIIYNINCSRPSQSKQLKMLMPEEWAALRDTKDLLEPFADTVIKMQSTDVTISKALVYTLALIRHLGAFTPTHTTDQTQLAILDDFRSTMLSDMETRFRYVTDPDHVGFDAIWAAATLADINTASRLEEKYVLPAIDYILALEPLPLAEEASGESVQIAATAAAEPPKSKKSKLDDLVDAFVKPVQAVSSSTQMTPVDRQAKARLELHKYKESLGMVSCKNALEFWTTIGPTTFPTIFKRMGQLLSVPATTASVERMFSITGKAVNSDRNRLKFAALRSESILVGNKKLLLELYPHLRQL